MDPGKIFQIITNSTLLATRLLSRAGDGPLQFSEPRYCLLLAEDAPPTLRLAQVTASHKDGLGVRYSIRAGNRDGLFTIDQRSGLITLAAPLDYELRAKHELLVAAEAAGHTVHVMVHVAVVDVNDNPPHFLEEDLRAAVIEEDDIHLPAIIAKVEARDLDAVDKEGLVYSVGGDGVEGLSPGDAFFTINPHTGELLQLRALDRDPPLGRDTWKVRVQVRDGQRVSPSLAAVSRASRRPRVTEGQHDQLQDSGAPQGPSASSSRGPSVAAEGHSLMPEDLSVPIPDGHSPLLQESKSAGNQQSFLQDSSTSGNLYSPSQDPTFPPRDAILRKGKEEEEKEEEEEEREGEDQGKSSNAKGKLIHRMEEKENKKGKTSGKGQEWKISTPSTLVQKENDDIIQRRKTSEQRQLGDEDHRNAEGDMTPVTSRGKRSTHENGMPEPPDVPSRSSHTSRVLGRNPLQRFTRLRRDDSEGSGLECDPESRKTIHTKVTLEPPMPSRLKLITRAKHKHTGSQRGLPTLGNMMKRRPLERGLRDKTHTTEGSLSTDVILSKPEYFPDDSLQHATELPIKETEGVVISPHRGSKSQHISKPSPPTDSESHNDHEEPREREHKPPQRLSGSTAPTMYSGDVHDLSSGSSDDGVEEESVEAEAMRVTKNKREVPQEERRLLPAASRSALKQVSQDQRYVRRLKAVGGECQDDGGVFATSSEEIHRERPHVLDMRRVRVHVAETVVTVVVKDVNDNAPVFPNVTIYGEVQENGPIDQSAGVVWAWDADDQQEGTNAHLTYSIEKNVVEDHSGQAIFTVHPETGLVRTAVCCLDRETTPEYHIQVVATDGGGLKGTGTVVVRLTDVNDNSPRLTRDLWQVGVDETWGLGPPGNDTLLQVTTDDQDTSNYFFYRVVEGSGWGWQHFGMRTHGRVGQLFARMTLDHEDPAHRRGFHFMIQVTDKGRGGWSDARHTDTAWVEVRLRDVNDNPPQFLRPLTHVTVREDAAPGTLLARLPATDPDMMNQQQVHYYVEGGWGALSVDESGEVRLWRALDREAPGGEVSTAWVVAVDEGHPSLSSTATLTITVTDVNDCPPRLLPPTLLHVAEGAPASLLGLLTATDDDVWALAHGPPFNFTLAPSNPDHVLNTLSIKFDPNLDSRRGGAEVWTVGPMDREEHRQLMAEVVVADAGGLAATQPVTIIIDDVNDNPMKPATKTIYLWKTQGGVIDAAIGRVYVEDPDDWDLQDKTFMWSGPPHPLFTLQPKTGDIFASTLIREGRYDLHFSVSDRVWDQYVEAKVTVNVKYLSPEALAHAIPLTLTPTTPAALASGWTPAHGGGGLGTLTEAVMQVLGRPAEAVEIISVYGLPTPNTTSVPTFSRTSSTDSILAAKASPAAPSLTCVWLSVKQMGGGFMDPVRLYGLLAIHLHHLEKMMKLRVALDVHTLKGEAEELVAVSSEPDNAFPHNPSSVASLASVALPLQVVDTNLTSLVTPRLTRAHNCNTHKHYGDEVCTATSCLNGGRCLGMDTGNRCVCPEGSWGLKCKVLTRTFTGSGWAWVQPIPPCIPTTLSIRILSHHPQALLLYSGPLSSTSSHPHNPSTPMIALQLVNGQPQAVLEGARGAVKVQVNVTLSTSTWHTLHLHLDAQGVTLMVDLCGHGWTADTTNDAHCIARAQWVDTEVSKSWGGSVPLQLGGLAQPYPLPGDFGWSATLVHQALDGCLSHLTVNGELIDLGESAYSSKSVSGCRPQEIACRERQTSCGLRGHCVDGLKNPRCECQPGWSGPKCTIPTVPVAFGQASYTKVALSFTPDPFDVTLQLRIRTRGNHNGLLMQLASNQQSHALKLQLRGGVACASVYGVELAVQEVCLESFPLGDGLWHTIQVGRHGHNLIISVDDGDGWRQNNTLATLFTTLGLRGTQAVTAVPPMPINIDKQDGTTLGGVPEFKGLSLITVYEDLQESCVDDVRVSGHSLPLPPSLNGTIWGQVTIQQNLEQGCNAPNMCNTTTCLPPLSCHDSWRLATCSCAPGQQLVNISCQDINECVFQPCLNGGTCYNLRPAYHCACDPAHIGDNCEWMKIPMKPNPLTAPMAITAITLSMIVIMVIGVLLTIRIHLSRAARTIGLCPASMEGVRDAIEDSETVQGVTNSHENKEGNTFLQSPRSKAPNKQIFLSPKGTKVLVTPVGLSTLGCEAVATKGVSPLMTRSTTKIPGSKVLKGHDETNVEICSTAAVDIAAENVDFDQKRNIAWIKCSKTICSTSECPVAACSTIMCSQTTNKMQQVNIGSCMNSVQPLLANNDLRAYAYEGDSMPYGSLNSTVLGHSNTS